MRSTAQLISYSVSLSLIILTVIFTLGSVNLLDILAAQQPIGLFFALLPMAILFIISAVAECSRAPFDFEDLLDNYIDPILLCVKFW